MFGLDDQIASLSSGQVFLVVMAIAALLGLRHATDPDHLTAVSTLVAGEREFSPRRAGALGFSWGLGHATTLFGFGLPIVLFDSYLPDAVQTAAEVAVGFVIMALALRLLMRWRRGHFHAHEHRHTEGDTHRHLHGHAADRDAHDHGHAGERLGRSPLQAYGIGLIHGIGGSAGVGILLLAAIPDHVEGVIALALFAACTAVSMSIASSTLGYALSRGSVMRRFVALVPALGALSLAFGAWYALGAAGAVPYYF